MTTAADPKFASRAVARLSTIEFWERYSYFTVFALLTLFVSAPLAKGGLGWRSGQSLRFFGLYLLIVQTSPILGGVIADRWLGKRMSLRLGAAALSMGHLLLATAAALPLAAHGSTGLRLSEAAAALGAPLAQWATPPGLASDLSGSYWALTVSFYAAVALIAIGNGLFKPILTVVIGRLPFESEAARSAAFTTFFLYINVGGLASIVLGGWLSQRFGWSLAFGGSALGMVVSIATMMLLDRAYIRPFLGAHAGETDEVRAARSKSYVPALAILLLLVALCASFSYQSYGFVALFTSQLVRRDLGGFLIPPAWFTALNPLTIMILTPILLRIWRRGGPGASWTEVQRIAVALMLMTLGFAPLVAASLQARGGNLASPLWVAAAIMIIAVTELLYSPAALAAATRVAPPRLQTVAVGSQGAAVGVGGWLSGQLGALAFEGDKALVMGAIAALALVSGAVLFRGSRRLTRFGL